MSQQECGSESRQEDDLADSLSGLTLTPNVSIDTSAIWATIDHATATEEGSAYPGSSTIIPETSFHPDNSPFAKTAADSTPPLCFLTDTPMSAEELVQIDVHRAAQKQKAQEVRNLHPDAIYLDDEEAIKYELKLVADAIAKRHEVEKKRREVEKMEKKRAQETFSAVTRAEKDKRDATAREEELKRRAEEEVDVTYAASDEELNDSEFE